MCINNYGIISICYVHYCTKKNCKCKALIYVKMKKMKTMWEEFELNAP